MLDPFWLDKINGIFECSGALFILQSVVRLYRDKQVRGVSWLHMGFFASWGYWNILYYWGLGQWLSWAGGLAITLTNSFYLAQIIYYERWPGGRRVRHV